MIPPNALEPLLHGGDLGAARNRFPGAPEPFLDLSTGINPHPYPIPKLPAEIFARLPGPARLMRFRGLAAAAHDASSESNVVPAPGRQSLMTLLASLIGPAAGRSGTRHR
jgi:cobalamin biosynthetic protein CobC